MRETMNAGHDVRMLPAPLRWSRQEFEQQAGSLSQFSNPLKRE